MRAFVLGSMFAVGVAGCSAGAPGAADPSSGPPGFDCKDGSSGQPLVLMGKIQTDGTLRNLRVVKSVPPHDQEAIEAVAKTRYRPAVRNGQPVVDDYVVVVQICPDGMVPPVGSAP